MKYKAIIWDWNGTLMDDLDAAFGAVNKMLGDRGRELISLEQYYSYLETPISKFYAHLFDLNKVSLDDLLREYHINYEALASNLPADNSVYRLLSELKRKGYRQAVLSAYESSSLNRWICRYGIGDIADIVSGADNFHAESKLVRAKQVMDSLCLLPDECVFVGDTLHDFELANELGSDCVLLTSGHNCKADLEKCGCVLADSLENAVAALKV